MRRTAITLATLTLVVATACGGESDTTPEPPGESSAPEGLDPCTLLPVEDFPPQENTEDPPEPYTALMSLEESFVGCVSDTYEDFSFGYKNVDDDAPLSDLLVDTNEGEYEEVDGLGDEALIQVSDFGASVSQRIMARFGSEQLFLSYDAVKEDELSDDELVALMETMGSSLPDEVSHVDVEMAEGCPDPAGEEVTAIVDPVVTARGAADTPTSVLTCQYVSEDGSTVRLDASTMTLEDLQITGFLQELREEPTTLAGLEAFVYADEFAVQMTVPTDDDVIVRVDVLPGEDVEAPAVEPVTALVESFVGTVTGP
ncbi:hypothetical protein ACHAAC_12680 [Aeromicrobium sp. CF4.19]|uniref:hypothetical protein n=1 Tax=Aeromicrobium sp. CF4.19 TaxID=3373082 RepID=UPI003EE43204